jgi:hypothetical protein
MDTATLKSSLHQIVDASNDMDLLEFFYEALASNKNQQENLTLSKEQKELLDSIKARHHKGESKSYSWSQTKNYIKNGGQL